MLRSLISASERLYTCLVIPRKFQTISEVNKQLLANIRCFHVGSVYRDIDRSSLRQKEPTKITISEDMAIETEEVKPGSLYPTIDTHSMIVDGTRYDELPIIHIKSTQNNTNISITNYKGEVLTRTSAGMEGFKNARKGTNIAGQAAGVSAGQKALKNGIPTVRVCVRGLGPGRLPSIKGLQMAGLNIVSITDTTRIQQHGPRPRKKRRL